MDEEYEFTRHAPCTEEEWQAICARVAELERENAGLLQANRDCTAWFDALNSDHQKALKTLVDLACLGNGPHYGNSTGNVIAQRCLDYLID